MKGLLQKYTVLLLITIAGCVDPISFETVNDDSQLVIYGNFTQLNQDHTIEITRTEGFGITPTPVSGACVKVADNMGNSAEYQESESGKYVLSAGLIAGVPGRFYHIEIVLSEGKTYSSTPQLLPRPIEPEEIYFEIGPREIIGGSTGSLIDKIFIDVFIDTPLLLDQEQNIHLRWTVEEVYSFVDRSCGTFDSAETCYFIDPIDDAEVLLFENEAGAQDYLSRFRVRTRELVPFDEFTARHYFLVSQFTISQEELDYWKNVRSVANQTGSLFEVQPAPVMGNIFEVGNEQSTALGFFSVSAESNLRIFTTPNSIKPYPVFTCNDESFFRDHQPECCFCSTKEGISIPRPDYWDED